MPVLHGKNDTAGDYESSAFFIRHDPSSNEFLFFGDVSPDILVLAGGSFQDTLHPLNHFHRVFVAVWPTKHASYLSPKHLVDELAALGAKVPVVLTDISVGEFGDGLT
ncbi:hypothetical protein BJV78DRAFT_1249872 [Lactifluus subvellereus]|nr:hypothetical protein BJV78DRAFT_1249872 [Lactifluus subvellereus]